MPSQVLRLHIDISALVGVILLEAMLPQQVQAVELVKDLYANTIANLARFGALDRERRGIKSQSIKLFPGDHLVSNIICDVIPCLVDLWAIPDKFGSLKGWSYVVSYRPVVGYYVCGSCVALEKARSGSKGDLQ
jgi:hypothetical protein